MQWVLSIAAAFLALSNGANGRGHGASPSKKQPRPRPFGASDGEQVVEQYDGVVRRAVSPAGSLSTHAPGVFPPGACLEAEEVRSVTQRQRPLPWGGWGSHPRRFPL